MKDNESIKQAKYSFIQEDVQLVVSLNPNTGRENLVMEKWDNNEGVIEFEQSLRCTMPTIVKELSPGSTEFILDGEFEKSRLSEEDKWFALTSWAAAVQELGKDAFIVLKEIENQTNAGYPMAYFLLQFMVKVDSAHYLKLILEQIESSCRFQGKIHFPSLYANFNILLYIIQHQTPASEEVMDFIYSYDKKFLFIHPDYEERQEVARSIYGPKYPEYTLLLEDEESIGLVAANPYAIKIPGFENLFTDLSSHVRLAVAKNKEAINLKGFQILLTDQDPRVQEAARKTLSQN